MALVQSLGYLPSIGRDTLSLDAYFLISRNQAFWRSMGVSVWIAFASTTISTILAIGCALVLRQVVPHWRWAGYLFQINIPIPHLVGAIAIQLLLAQSGLLARLAYTLGAITEPSQFPVLIYDPANWGIILQYVWKTTCFTGIILLASLQGLDNSYEAVAQNLGANRWQRFWYVVLPFIMPSVVSSSVLVFAFTFGAFEVPFLLGQRFPPALPVLAYQQYTSVDLNDRPQAMAMSIILALVCTLLIFAYMQVTEKYVKRATR